MILFYVLLMFFLFFHAFHFFIYVFHYSAKIKFDSHDSLPLEKALTFHIVIIIIQFLIMLEITTTIIHS